MIILWEHRVRVDVFLTDCSHFENIEALPYKANMHIISRKILREFCQKHSDSCDAIYNWRRIASKADWKNLNDVQKTYRTAEAVGSFTVFNIKENHYRLIVDIIYASQRIYIKYILTHADYDKGKWKNDPYF